MAALDPVSWDTIEATMGAPAKELREYIEQVQDDYRDETPYDAVLSIHNSLSEDDNVDVSVPDQAEVFFVSYLLERNGIISPEEGGTDGQIPSVADRRPSSDHLQELSWERERTMWWIAVRFGVHWALVRYWLYEDDIPLKERNFTADGMEKIRAYREQSEP